MEDLMSERARIMADNLMNKVRGYTQDGLPDCYASFQEYLYDFWPDLPWDGEAVTSCKHILEQHGEVLDLVQAKFGFDLRAEVR